MRVVLSAVLAFFGLAESTLLGLLAVAGGGFIMIGTCALCDKVRLPAESISSWSYLCRIEIPLRDIIAIEVFPIVSEIFPKISVGAARADAAKTIAFLCLAGHGTLQDRERLESQAKLLRDDLKAPK